MNLQQGICGKNSLVFRDISLGFGTSQGRSQVRYPVREIH